MYLLLRIVKIEATVPEKSKFVPVRFVLKIMKIWQRYSIAECQIDGEGDGLINLRNEGLIGEWSAHIAFIFRPWRQFGNRRWQFFIRNQAEQVVNGI